MSRDFLLETIRKIQPSNYNWTLYFLKIDFRSKPNPYYIYKHTFRMASYLQEYVNALTKTMLKYQIEPLESVQNYDGENSKTSCDKISIEDELIKEQWEYLRNSICGAQREQISGKYQGYILDGQPLSQEDLCPITIMKACNPIISLDKKNTKVFKHNEECELDNITDELCRLYLTSDFLVIDKMMYTFNHSFESLFRIEKTMHHIKENRIALILQSGAFDEPDVAEQFMKRYTSPKTFITLKAERVDNLTKKDWQADFLPKLNLEMVEGKIKIETQEQANLLIKYLCNKIFQDKETDNLIEVNSVVNDNVNISTH